MHLYRFTAVLLLSALVGCVDAPASLSAPDLQSAGNNQPLADTFDELARQSAEDGDASRADEFTVAALAVRNGVAPTRITVLDGTSTVFFDAIVTSVEWQVAENVRPPAFRSLIAWRRGDDGVVRLLSVSTAADSSPLRNPLSTGATAPAGIFAIATATYRETTISRPPVATAPEMLWIGYEGFGKIAQLSASGACNTGTSVPVPQGIGCTGGRFLIDFSIKLQQVNVRPAFQVNANTLTRSFSSVGAQQVNGYRLQFTCLRVSSRSGCS